MQVQLGEGGEEMQVEAASQSGAKATADSEAKAAVESGGTAEPSPRALAANGTGAMIAAGATVGRSHNNWCLDGWKAKSTQHAADLSKAHFCGWGKDLTCTPFKIKPYTHGRTCGGGGSALTGAEEVRKWVYPGAKDSWVFHACDGAGIQGSDCNGDIYFAEHLGPSVHHGSCHYPDGKKGHELCDYSKEPWGCQHNVCDHWHFGLEEWNSEYQCGWWARGKFRATNSWYKAAGWTGLGSPEDLGGWKGAHFSTYSWTCHPQSAPRAGEGGWDPHGHFEPYSRFPGGPERGLHVQGGPEVLLRQRARLLPRRRAQGGAARRAPLPGQVLLPRRRGGLPPAPPLRPADPRPGRPFQGVQAPARRLRRSPCSGELSNFEWQQ